MIFIEIEGSNLLMTKKISERKPVLEFIDIATKYCTLIESRENMSRIKLFQGAFIILPQLCHCGMRLPEVYRFPDYKKRGIPNDKYMVILHSLHDKFKEWDLYKKIFDPYERKDKEWNYGSLADDVADVYRDIKPGLQEWDSSDAADRRYSIWDWSFLFEHHWGHHATGAFQTLYFLLYWHIEDKYGDHIGIREDI
jgi:hypothetical protein